MKNFRKIVLCLCLLCLIQSLASCAKVAAPSPYEGSDYPHSYPRN